MSGELLGLPSVSIMTEAFVDAATLMARVLGADDHHFIAIDHPISSATTDDLVARARDAARQVVDHLVRPDG
ncbi:MAG: hypothetical protein ACFCVK_02905 [Acidimicrobiales bacterium]